MPRLKRVIQRWIISKGARRQVTQNELRERFSPFIRIKQGLARWHVGKKATSSIAHGNAQEAIDRETTHYALTRAFRAAGIFGTETRNELTPLIKKDNWSELKEKIGERRTNRIRQVYGQITHMSEELIHEEYVRNVNRPGIPPGTPRQLPVHGKILLFRRRTSKAA